MKTVIRGGILLGILVSIWTFIYGAAAMHKSASTAMLFPLVATVIELVVLVWALRRTAAEGRRYMGQVSAGTLLAFVGGCLILATSYLYVTQFHPTMMAEANEATIAAFRSQGWDEAKIQQTMAAQAPYQTAIAQAVVGFLATVITGVVLSAILAIFIRSKAPKLSPAVPA